MGRLSNSWMNRLLAVALAVAMLPSSIGAQSQGDASGFRLKRDVEIVLVNVVVRDKSGNIIRGLKKDDFAITEDGKAQTLSSFDFEQTDTEALPPLETQPTIIGAVKNGNAKNFPVPQDKQFDFHGRRVMVLF